MASLESIYAYRDAHVDPQFTGEAWEHHLQEMRERQRRVYGGPLRLLWWCFLALLLFIPLAGAYLWALWYCVSALLS